MDYKKQEILEHFNDSIINYDKEWIENNHDDLHHEIFNTDYYIIGTYKATQWLGDQVFNIIDFINYPTRIFPIGRLDKDSEGLILLTDDGDIVNKILRASNNHEKEYIVKVDKPISQTFVQRMSAGITLEELGKTTKSCRVEKLNTYEFKIILTQGLNRQIRRMCEYLNYEVQSLKRTRIMNIHQKCEVGTYRDLTIEELKTLNNT